MRGKTNVGGSGGISINAEVQDMIIQSGQIAAGDFVEHYTTDDYIAQENTVAFEFEINGYMIFKEGSTIAAYKNGQKVVSYSDYRAQAIGRYENFIIFIDYLNASHSYVCGVLKIENDTFTLVDIISVDIDHVNFNRNYVCGGNGKIVFYYPGYTSSKFYFCVANISSSGILSEFTSTDVSKELSMLGADAIFYYNGSFKIFFGNGSSSSDLKSTLAEIFIDSNNNVTIGENILSIRFNKILLQKGNKLIFAGKTSIISPLRRSYDQISVLNLETYGVTTMMLPDDGEVLSNMNNDGYFISTGKILVSCAWTGNEQYVSNKLRLCKYNENTGLISIEDEIVLPDDYSTSEPDTTNVYTAFQSALLVAGIDENNINIYAQIIKHIYYTRAGSSSSTSQVDDKNIYLYNIIDGGIEKHPQEGYVLPYNSGHPIGVAKDAGIAGDTIGVYVPVPVDL